MLKLTFMARPGLSRPFSFQLIMLFLLRLSFGYGFWKLDACLKGLRKTGSGIMRINECRKKKSLLQLHVALGNANQPLALAKSPEDTIEMHCFTSSGHGGKGNPARPVRIESVAGEPAGFLAEKSYTSCGALATAPAAMLLCTWPIVSGLFFTYSYTWHKIRLVARKCSPGGTKSQKLSIFEIYP
jgi:hypothetical protein